MGAPKNDRERKRARLKGQVERDTLPHRDEARNREIYILYLCIYTLPQKMHNTERNRSGQTEKE